MTRHKRPQGGPNDHVLHGAGEAANQAPARARAEATPQQIRKEVT